MSFFGVNLNPFSTPVGQKIEQATDGNLPSVNWALNMEICDIINESEDGPRDAVKAIKRRLYQAAGKNYTVVLYTLTVLETCVKNCGRRFHVLACSREFVLELVKMIGPKNEPPTAVQEKVLSLIQTWADTFRYQPHTQGVVQVYQELKAKGMQFPMTNLDAMAPIITPERSVPGIPTCGGVPSSEIDGNNISGCDATATAAVQQQIQQIQSSQPVQLPDCLVAKLRSELEVVQGNMRVLGEMLQYFTSPDQQKQQQQQQKKSESAIDVGPDASDLELMHQLYSTCKAMQERVVDLIGRLVDDEMTAELLRINDELNNLFLRYSRYKKNKIAPEVSAILAHTLGYPPGNLDDDDAASILSGETSKRPEQSLIDLNEDTVHSLERQINDIGISDTDGQNKSKISHQSKRDDHPDNDEFDMFAQSRTASYETAKNSGSKYEDNLEELSGNGSLSSAILNRGASLQSRESSITSLTVKSMTPKEHGDQESLTSSEFERFLAERAAAAEALPNVPTVTTAPSATTTTTGSTNIQRQINKDQDKSLFAL